MDKILAFLLFLSFGQLPAQIFTTPFERSSGQETGTYEEVIRFYQQLAHSSEYLRVDTMGLTDSGESLHLVTITSGSHDPKIARQEGKTIILINNGIHPGEPDGIEASMMLARDLLRKENLPLLNNIYLAIVPVYNIGGALNRNSTSRVNQSGPEAYGFRGNARNFDLNRDFIKADTRNTFSFYEIYHSLQPDIFIDTHVSNGADYQYKITHLATQHNKIGGGMGEYIYREFTPELEARMEARNFSITPYVNVFNRTPDERGFTQFLDNPRYSTGYTSLFNTLGFMIETHMLKPYEERVKATYAFLETILEIAIKDGDKIRRLHRENPLPVAGEIAAISWTNDSEKTDTITFMGYEGEMIESKVTGFPRLFYNQKKPFTKKIPYYNHFKPSKEIIVPIGYVIPQGWHAVIDRLKRNQVELVSVKKDTLLDVETYTIDTYETSNRAYEGHYPHYNISLTTWKKKVYVRQGDMIAYVNQPSGRFLIQTLEPEATDSYFSWNFFDTILQQKEGFSPYVFEDMAYELLQENDALRIVFEKKIKEDQEFAQDWYQQLSFIYDLSEYSEKSYMKYPIYRLVP